MPQNNQNQNEKGANSVGQFDRRSYLKRLGATGSGLALGGFGGRTITGELPVGTAQAATTTLDDFNRSNPEDAYTGTTNGYEGATTDLEGSSTTSLHCIDTYAEIARDDKTTPRGKKYNCKIRIPSGSSAEPSLLVSVQSPSNPLENCYFLHANRSSNEFAIRRRKNDTTQWSAEVTYDITPGDYEFEIVLEDSRVKGVLRDANGNHLTDTGWDSDSNYGLTKLTGGGFGFYTGGSESDVYYDYLTRQSIGSWQLYSVVDTFEDPDELGSRYLFNKGSSYANGVTQYDSNYSGSNILAPSLDGEGVLEHTGGDVEMFSLKGGQLPNYPSSGDKFSSFVLSEGGSGDTYLAYGVQDPDTSGGDVKDFYSLNVDFTNERVTLFKSVNGTWSSINGKNVSIEPDKWYNLQVDWNDGSHTVTLNDRHGNVIGDFTASDSEFKDGGVGFITYPSSTSEKYYWDHFVVGEATYHKGGFGPKVLRDSHPYTEDTAHSGNPVEDYRFTFDYAGYDGESKYHEITIGGSAHTYLDQSGDDKLDEKTEIGYWGFINKTDLTVKVQYPDGTPISDDSGLVGSDNTLLYRLPDQTKVAWAKDEEWENLIKNNWNETNYRTTVRKAMEDGDVIKQGEEAPGLVSVALFAAGIITLPISGTAGTLAGLALTTIGGVNMVRGFVNESDGGTDFSSVSNSTSKSTSTGYFDWADPLPGLMMYSVTYRIDVSDVPSDQDLLIKVEQTTHGDSSSYDKAKDTAVWEGLIKRTSGDKFDLQKKELLNPN